MLFYFCHLKKLVRPETFGPYYVCFKILEVSIRCATLFILTCEIKNLCRSPDQAACNGYAYCSLRKRAPVCAGFRKSSGFRRY